MVTPTISRTGLEIYETVEETSTKSKKTTKTSKKTKSSDDIFDTDLKKYGTLSRTKTTQKNTKKNNKTNTSTKNKDKQKDTSNSNSTTSNTNYTLETETPNYVKYVGDIYSSSYESDYSDISSNASLTIPINHLDKVYRGKKVILKKGLKNDITDWDKDMVTALEGFITEITYNNEKIDLKVDGMHTLLEKEEKFNFTKTKRSKIVTKIIEAAGLKAKVNVSGLKDPVVNFTNVSTSGDSKAGSSGSIGDSSISDLAQQVCENCNTDREKAEAIHSYIHKHVKYPHPNYLNHRKCPKEVLKSGLSNCCDRARTGHEMANAVGLENRGLHGHQHVWVQYKIDGKWVNSDPGDSRPKLGPVWGGEGHDRTWDFPKC